MGLDPGRPGLRQISIVNGVGRYKKYIPALGHWHMPKLARVNRKVIPDSPLTWLVVGEEELTTYVFFYPLIVKSERVSVLEAVLFRHLPKMPMKFELNNNKNTTAIFWFPCLPFVANTVWLIVKLLYVG